LVLAYWTLVLVPVRPPGSGPAAAGLKNGSVGVQSL